MFRLSTQRFQSLVTFKKSNNGHIGVLSLNRPEAKNALSKALLEEFNQNITQIKKNQELRTLIIRSNVPKVFCAGADLKERLQMNESDTRHFVALLRHSFQLITSIPVPTIACIDGVALGGGLELALACDLRVASADSIVGLPETSLAIIPGAGGTQRLSRLIGPSQAKMWIFTGRKFPAKEAAEAGVLDVVEGVNCARIPVKGTEAVEELLKESSGGDSGYRIALRLAQEISRNGPLGLRAAKKAVTEGLAHANIEEALDVERLAYEDVLKSKDRLEALKAFSEKRLPLYKGE